MRKHPHRNNGPWEEKADGSLVRIEPEPNRALSTDARQSVTIGSVDLGDGLQEFDNMTAQVGSLEERTLIKALADEEYQRMW